MLLEAAELGERILAAMRGLEGACGRCWAQSWRLLELDGGGELWGPRTLEDGGRLEKVWFPSRTCRKNPGLLECVSERHLELRGGEWMGLPPVSTPPRVLLSFGIPPANKPASTGGVLTPPAPPASLFPRDLKPADGGGGGGGAPGPPELAAALGAFGTFGTDGGFPSPDAPGPPGPATFPVTVGALRSFVVAFRSLIPFVMSVLSAP